MSLSQRRGTLPEEREDSEGDLGRAREISASLEEMGRRSCERLLELDAADSTAS